MNFNGLGNAFNNGYLGNVYPYADRTCKSNAGSTGLAESLQDTGNAKFIKQLQNKVETSEAQADVYAGSVYNISRMYSTGKPNAANFADAFPMYDVVTHVGNTTESLLGADKTSVEQTEAYTEYLKEKYGNVTIQSVGKDQKSMDALGAGTFGTGNVVIAPNILEQMAKDPEKAAYYEGKIQNYFDSVPRYQAELSAMGHEIHSGGIVIHPDGTVTHYICGDLKPEVRAKIEARIKAEQEAKRNRREKYQELCQEAADRRREFMEIYYTSSSSAVPAYEKVINTFSNDLIENIRILEA